MYFLIPAVHPCMHRNCGVISGRHTSRDCAWPIILATGLYTTCRGERELVVIRFNVTFLPLRSHCDKMCTSFLNDAEGLTTYGCIPTRALMQSDCLYLSLYFEYYIRILLCD